MRVGKKSGPLHHPALKPANLPDFLAVARKRLLVGAAVLFAVLFIAATGAAIFGFRQKIEAEKEIRRAESPN
jgi:hypothetical protein